LDCLLIFIVLLYLTETVTGTLFKTPGSGKPGFAAALLRRAGVVPLLLRAAYEHGVKC
jgi:hypothetical protein